MTRRFHLPVLDRRTLLRGAAAALVASLAGCRLSLEDPAEPGGVAPDAPAGTPDAEAIAGSGFERCGDELCLDLAHPSNAVLRDVDGARTLTFEGRKLIVVRVADDEIIVLSAICTHTGCTVKYAAARSDIECPCHGSTFALDGSVTHGPAARPLAPFQATLDPATGIVTVALT